MAMENRSEITNEVVVGFFRNGEDAHRAINELLDEGFRAGEIGAAFRSGPGGTGAGGDTSTGSISTSPGMAGRDISTTVSPGTTGSGSGITGAASDTSAVNPGALATGSGTWAAGAGRPLPSGNTPHHPQYLHPEDNARAAAEARTPAGEPFENRSVALGTETRAGSETGQPNGGQRLTPGDFPSTGGFHDEPEGNAREEEGGSWWDKLKHSFAGHESTSEGQFADSESMNFGTGEGHLGAMQAQYEYPYSGRAFENSFSGMGLPQEHSHRLASELRRGGAIVSVNATGRVSEAERILERNNGSIRYEDPGLAEEGADQFNDEGERVQVFGEVQRVYPGYMGKDDLRSRKAS